MRIPDQLTCLLRNLYAGQEATVRTEHGATDLFQIAKRLRQGCILSPFLFNFYAEYIMENAGLEEAQAGIKIAGRNINNLRYADDTTFMEESEEELKSLLIKVKEENEKAGKTHHSKNEDHGNQSHHSIANGGTAETVRDFIFLGSKITADSYHSRDIKRHLLLERKAMTNLDRVFKNREFADNGHSSQSCGFPVVMYGCESWTIKKAECQRIDAFETWCWRRLLRVLRDSWESLG